MVTAGSILLVQSTLSKPLKDLVGGKEAVLVCGEFCGVIPTLLPR